MAYVVDLDSVIEQLENEWGYEGMREDLFKLPTVDPVHAAGGCYCRECKHYEEVTAVYGKDMVCTNQGCMKVAKLPDDFCSRGERSEGE